MAEKRPRWWAQAWATALLVSLLPLALSAQEPAPAPAKVKLDVRQARLGDAVLALHQLTKANLVADAYADDLLIGGLVVERASAPALIAPTAAMFSREMIAAGRVVVLRDPHWLIRLPQEPEFLRLFPDRWEKTGAVEARAMEPLVYVRRFRLVAKERPVAQVMQAIGRLSGWQVRLPPPLRTRRVTVAFGDVTGGEAIDALATLLNYAGQVTLHQTAEQRAEEARWLAAEAERQAGAPFCRRLSDALKVALLDRMTPAQRAEVSNGGRVSLPVTSLGPELRASARRYAEAKAGLSPSPRASPINWKRFGEFSLEVDLQVFVGIRGYTEDGRGIGY